MRNSVKATVDAYDGTVTLYAWDDQDPILKAWSSAFPGTVEPKSDIPESLLEHLRYPEDMFKVQRYQFARYHVTDPNAWFQDNNRWDVPEDPNGAKSLQPPYRMFVTQPPGLVPDDEEGNEPSSDAAVTSDGPVWSLTSTFVPYKRSNLAAYISVDSDATSETYGQMRVINVIDEQQQGPGQVANAVRSDRGRRRRAGRVQPKRQHGHLRQPAHRPGRRRADVRRAGLRLAPSTSEANFPILRYVLVSYRGGVGIGTTLTSALDEAKANAAEAEDPTDEPTDEPTDDADGRADRTNRPTSPPTSRPPALSRNCWTRPSRSSCSRTRPSRPATSASTRSTSTGPATWSPRRLRSRTPARPQPHRLTQPRARATTP